MPESLKQDMLLLLIILLLQLLLLPDMQKVTDAANGIHVKKLGWGKFYRNASVFLAF